MFELVPDSTVVITGASSGIGREAAIQCAKNGAAVLLIGRNRKTLEETAAGFPAGAVYEILEADLTNCEGLKEALNEKCRALPPVSGFVSCAGNSSTIPLKMLDPESLRNDFSLNVIAGFFIARQLASKKKISAQGASFVFIASVTAHCGAPGLTSYAASKGALISGVRSMAAELAPMNIRCNTISPGFIQDTGITRKEFENMPQEAKDSIVSQHLLGLGTTADVAAAILFLLSRQARWITGTDLVTDGGFSI